MIRRVITQQIITTWQIGSYYYHKLYFESMFTSQMNVLVEKLESVVDTYESKDYDVLFSDGVLTLKLGSEGTFVVNKQPPNKQIWLSSPISGPKRFDYRDGDWVNLRNNELLEDLLSQELSQVLGKSVAFKEKS
ncbi:Mitochondrial chaperone Frataxin [Dinochytrium kinnereticum]|nr:Mitochondrial chaperone Frataxin [Dinochytrium kinnereticum]